jgi:predicted enzyme related to lactoylglutathione lyase
MQLLLNVDVDDLANGIRFYTVALGLRVGRRFGDQAVELLGGEVPIYLLLKVAGSTAIPVSSQQRSYERHWTPVHFDVAVADIDAAVIQAQSVGAVLEGDVQIHKWGRLALMADPFGNGFCFIQFLGRGYDEISN